jgi:hypothetical protein
VTETVILSLAGTVIETVIMSWARTVHQKAISRVILWHLILLSFFFLPLF